MKIYYVYRHIRLDRNIPFYIGIGTCRLNATKNDRYYLRAYNKNSRNNYWIKIANKTDYNIEIVYEDEDLNIIREKEIELIKLYGRLDQKTGTLCNFTDGGDGAFNPSSESIRKRLQNTIQRKGKDNHKSRYVYQYSMDGEFIKKYESINLAMIDLELKNHHGVRSCCIGKNHYYKNFQWFYEYKGKIISKCKYNGGRNQRKVGKYDINTMKLLENYKSLYDAVVKNNYKSHTGISLCCTGTYKTSMGYVWKYL